MNQKPKMVNLDFELGEKSYRAMVQLYAGQLYAGVRQMYLDDSGNKAYGKNGINVPLQYSLAVAAALVKVINESTGSTFCIVGGNDEEIITADECMTVGDPE